MVAERVPVMFKGANAPWTLLCENHVLESNSVALDFKTKSQVGPKRGRDGHSSVRL